MDRPRFLVFGPLLSLSSVLFGISACGGGGSSRPPYFGRFAPGMEADFIVLDPAATPLRHDDIELWVRATASTVEPKAMISELMKRGT